MAKSFFNKLQKSIERTESLLCVGLDPQIDIAFEDEVITRIVAVNKKIIEETIDYTACYKPNIAFYEQYGPEGIIALKKSLDLIPEDIPVIMDAKRGDIGNTATAYAQSIFGDYNVDAATLNGYLGKESLIPFLEYHGKAVFILCRTSNPGSDVFQTMTTIDKTGRREMFYLKLAKEVSQWSPDIGLVVAGNDPDALMTIRSVLPDIWILAPGIGAQGGSVEDAICAGIGKDGNNILLNVSRQIGQSASPGREAKKIRDQIKEALTNVTLPVNLGFNEQDEKKQLIKDIINEGCFKLGEFKLKSGLLSPFYIDLRLLISNPDLLSRVASAYASLVLNLNYKRIAGIPLAAIAIAACLSQHLSKPMVFPRLQKKEHGTGNTIEGTYNKGEKVLLVDDLITTGKSKLEAVEILRAEGLVITDLVVLLERGKQGRIDMEAAGINLHSYLSVEDFLDVSYEMGNLTKEKLEEIKGFVNQ